MTPPKKTFIIRKPKMRAPVNPQFAARRLADERDDDNHGCLCFALGVLFGPLGLLLAAIIAKAKGLIAALWGFVISWLVAGLIWAAAVLVFSRH
jgi:hypothetical protein